MVRTTVYIDKDRLKEMDMFILRYMDGMSRSKAIEAFFLAYKNSDRNRYSKVTASRW